MKKIMLMSLIVTLAGQLWANTDSAESDCGLPQLKNLKINDLVIRAEFHADSWRKHQSVGDGLKYAEKSRGRIIGQHKCETYLALRDGETTVNSKDLVIENTCTLDDKFCSGDTITFKSGSLLMEAQVMGVYLDGMSLLVASEYTGYNSELLCNGGCYGERRTPYQSKIWLWIDRTGPSDHVLINQVQRLKK